MVAQDSVESIAAFKRAVRRKREYVPSDEESAEGEVSNRGNKLKRGADLVSVQELSAVYSSTVPEPVDYNNHTRFVVKRRRRFNETNYDNEEEPSDEDEEDDPYKEIKLDEILAPINHPSEIANHPAISRTYNSRIVRNLASQTIEIIEKEQESVVQFSKLLDVFLGDDPEFILADKLNLPDYDHNLTKKAPTEVVAGEEMKEEAENEHKRITRNKSIQEMDPFFALPQFNSDPNFGVSTDEAEETRQLTQIALQRSQEFIRCLTTVRNGLVRAEKLKDQLFKWSKEMGGDLEADSPVENNKRQ